MARTVPRGLVGLLDHRVVLGLGVATIGVGVSTVTTGRLAASRCGVSTLGVRLVVASASAVVPTTAGLALLLLLRLGLGNRVAVVLLGVAGIGVAAITTRGVGVAAIRFGTSLRDARLVALRVGAVV